MKKLILILPFILLACAEEESNIEKERRQVQEQSAALDKQLEGMMGKERKDSMDAAIKQGGQELLDKVNKK